MKTGWGGSLKVSLVTTSVSKKTAGGLILHPSSFILHPFE
jgi:hypothetical protein